MAEEYKIEIGAELSASALSSLQSQINGLNINPIKIKIDDRNIKSQINNLRKQIQSLGNININLNSGLQVNGIARSMRQSGINAGNEFVNGFNNSISSISTYTNNAENTIRHMQRTLANMKLDRSSIDLVTQNLEQMNLEINRVATNINGNNLNISIRGIDELGRAVTIVKQFDYQSGRITNVGKTIAQSFETSADAAKRFQKEVNNAYSDLLSKQKQIGSLRIKLEGLDVSKNISEVKAIRQQITALETDYHDLFTVFGEHFSITQIEKLDQGFRDITSKVNILDAKMQDTSVIKQRETAYKQLLTTAKQIDSLELKIGSLKAIGGNSSQISVLESQLESLRNEYQSLATSLQGQLSTSQITELGKSFYETQNKLEELNAKIADTKAKMASNIKTDISNGSLENQVSQIESRFNSLNIKSDEVSTHIEKLKSLMSTMDSSDDIESVVADYEVFKNTLETVTNKVSVLQREQKSANMATKLEQSRTALNSQIDVWLKNNSAAAKQFGAQLREIQTQIKTADATQLQHLKAEFQEVTRQAKLAGVAGISTLDRFKRSLKTVSSYLSAAMLISRSVMTIRNMYNEVLKVDTAMTGLKRVTNLTNEAYSNMYSNMTKSAKKYGTTLSEIIDLNTSWVKLGFDSDISGRLAEITTMYQHVADLDSSTATENLVSTYKGFQKSLDESMGGDVTKEVEYIADIFDKLNNEYAVTAADVGGALQRSASSLQYANNTIQESSALVVGMNEVLQNAEKTGTILNTTALRLMGAKGKLEELGEDVDENIESVTKLQTHILNLTHGKVNIFNDDQTFKSTYQILKEIAAVYDSLSDVEAADLLETVAGRFCLNVQQCA